MVSVNSLRRISYRRGKKTVWMERNRCARSHWPSSNKEETAERSAFVFRKHGDSKWKRSSWHFASASSWLAFSTALFQFQRTSEIAAVVIKAKAMAELDKGTIHAPYGKEAILEVIKGILSMVNYTGPLVSDWLTHPWCWCQSFQTPAQMCEETRMIIPHTEMETIDELANAISMVSARSSADLIQPPYF